MGTSATLHDHRVSNVRVADESLIVKLKDGREIHVPLDWFPKLQRATKEQREKWEASAAGYGIHWPLIDEDLSVDGLLKGESAPAQKAAQS
jgi:hypothetical protein